MNEYDVLENLKKLIGQEFDVDEVIIAFGDYEEDEETDVVVDRTTYGKCKWVAFIDVENPQNFYYFELDEENIIVEVYML